MPADPTGDDARSGSGDAVRVPVELETATGTVRGALAIHTGPMRLAELVPLALELASLVAGRAEAKEAQEGRAVSCRAGCGACCRQMVPLSAPEVFFLGDLVGALAPARRSTLGARFDRVVRRLGDEGLLARLLAEDRSDDESMALAADYFRLGEPCPFLEDEACSIHASRPVACREFSVTSPAAWCADPFSHPVARVPVPRSFAAPLAHLTAELAGGRPVLVPLALAPVWAAQNRPLAARSWTGPELFERFMRHVRPADETGDGGAGGPGRAGGVDGSPGDGP